MRRYLIPIAALIFLCVPPAARSQTPWTWTDGNGVTRTQADLTTILADHDLWVQSKHARGEKADLTGADLHDADLHGANLFEADLDEVSFRGAHLEGANLSRASLENADFTSAHLDGANFENAHMKNADLTSAVSCTQKKSCDGMQAIYLNTSDPDTAAHACTRNVPCVDLAGADLTGAQLSDPDDTKCPVLSGGDPDGTILDGANLYGANLTGATLTCASLKGADLGNADLTDAQLDNAYVDGAVFEPSAMPDLKTIALAQHLNSVTYIYDPDPLAQLRQKFSDGAFLTQENQLTYAIRRRRAQQEPRIQRWFETVAFDWTCQYGLYPGHALKIWSCIFVLCWIVYAIVLYLPGASGIYKIQSGTGPDGGDEVEQQIRPGQIKPGPWWLRVLRRLHRLLSVFFWSGYFSLISAFNIGFPEINLGNWLQHLPRTDYRLKAKGWPRTVAGIQSLISLCLLLLWVASYFGHPFE